MIRARVSLNAHSRGIQCLSLYANLLRSYQSNADAQRSYGTFSNKKKRAPSSLRGLQVALEKARATVNSHSTPIVYEDMANKTLNFALSNRDLTRDIKDSSKLRTKLRITDPSDVWEKTLTGYSVEALKNEISQCIKLASIRGKLKNSVVNVGDLVTLQAHSLELFLVASVPNTLSGRNFVFIGQTGNIVHLNKASIFTRIPNVVPSKYSKILSSFVQLEQKHMNIAPIGIVDADFSRSESSKPRQLQDKRSISNEIVPQFESAVPEVGLESYDYQLYVAASQQLINSDVQTFIVPVVARDIYSQALKLLTSEAFCKSGEINTRLEKVHRELQYDENGNLNAPRTVSIFELMHRMETESNGQLSASTSLTSTLGKSPMPTIDVDEMGFSASTYLATCFVLEKQSALWNLHQSGTGNPRQSVTILPIPQIDRSETLAQYLKTPRGMSEFASYCADLAMGKKKLSKPKHFESVVLLLREFVNGAYENNDSISILVVTLLRTIESILVTNGHKTPKSQYFAEYSKAKAYDLLKLLMETDSIVNPFRFNQLLPLPNEQTSYQADLSQKYFDYLSENHPKNENKVSENLDELDNLPLFNLDASEKIEAGIDYNVDFYESDPLEAHREDLTDIPVYCIDSADAHEIDDGISIHEEEGKYLISVHIAEPSSYIKPESIISSIGLDRGTTTYLPDKVVPMLPQIISDIAGLGIDGKETRALTVQYSLPKEFLDEFINKKLENPEYIPEDNVLNTFEQEVYNSKKVFFSKLKNFRQGFTYNRSTEVLMDKAKEEQFKTQSCEDKDFVNLLRLYQISNIATEFRKLKNGINLESQNKSLWVNESNEYFNQTVFSESEDGYEVGFENSSQKAVVNPQSAKAATQLVTECMIMANHLTSKFATENDIKILYRTISKSAVKEVANELEKLSQEYRHKRASIEDLLHIFTNLPRVQISTENEGHLLMGLDMYTNATSPLRRYIDILNQWRFQDHALQRSVPSISDASLLRISSQLNSRNTHNKEIYASSRGFWEGLILKDAMRLPGDIANEIRTFDVRLSGIPREATFAPAIVPGLPYFKIRVEVTTKLLDDIEKGIIKKDLVLDSSRLKLKTLDNIECVLEFEYV